jgi:hypothetical protein
MIRFVVALACEAEPFLHRFRMERAEGAFPWFRSPEAALVISGVGKPRAAAATAYLHARTGEEPLGLWVNVGIAGHRDRSPGDVISGHTLVDVASGARFHPTRLDGRTEAAEIRTVDRPETKFDSDAAYEMEATGFYPVALGFSTSELVQCIKIVSDNRDTSAAALTAETIRDLVEGRADAVMEQVSRLRDWARELEPLRRERELASEVNRYRERWRFTTSESRRLKRLLGRWHTLSDGAELANDLSSARSADDAMQILEREVARLSTERPL